MKTGEVHSTILWALCPVLLCGCPMFGGDSKKECDVCGAVYCDNNRVVECVCRDASPDGGIDFILEVLSHCESKGTTCTQTRLTNGNRWEQGWEAGEAACFDYCPTPAVAECRTRSGGGGWYVCAPMGSDVAEAQEMVGAWLLEAASVDTTSSNTGDNVWLDAELDCVSCVNSCGCEAGSRCINGYCGKAESEDGITCCNRSHGAPCPNGDPCLLSDGTQEVCSTVGRCEGCETIGDCESGVCAEIALSRTSVCLPEEDINDYTLACHDEHEEVWSRDPCGNWSAVSAICSEGYHCQVAQCVESVAVIAISPMLIDLGDVSLGQSASFDVSVGNIGYQPLHVYDIEIDSTNADLFTLHSVPTSVAANAITTFTITFEPIGIGDVSAKLHIYSDDPAQPQVSVLVNGSGTN